MLACTTLVIVDYYKVCTLVLEQLEAENDEPEAPNLPATMMSKARQNRLHYMQLQDAVDSADLVPVERGAIENGLTRVAKRIPRHLKYSEETHQILTDSLEEAEKGVFNSLRIWRIKNTLKGDKEHETTRKRKPFPGLECRLGRPEFKKARTSLETSLWLMNPCMQQTLKLCYEQFSGTTCCIMLLLAKSKSNFRKPFN